MMDYDQLVNLITLLTVLATAIAGVIGAFRINGKVNDNSVKIDDNTTKTEEVHVMVNANLEAAKHLAQTYRTAMQAAGIKIPTDKSLKGSTDDAV